MPPEYFKALGIQEPPERGDYFIGLRSFLRESKLNDAEQGAIQDQRDRAAKRPWTAKDYPLVAAWLAANEKPLALVVEATKRPNYFNPLVPSRDGKGPGLLIGAPLPAAQKCRELALALATRAMLRVGEGKFDAAWQDLLACHRLARLVGRGAMNIEALIGVALNAAACHADLAFIQNASLSRQQMHASLKHLQGLPPMPANADRMDLGERLICLDALQSIHRGMFDEFKGGPAHAPDATALKALEMIDFEPTLRKANQVYDRITIAMRLPDRAQRIRELSKMEKVLDEEVRKGKLDQAALGKAVRLVEIAGNPEAVGKVVGKSIGDVALGMMLPAVMKVQNAFDRTEQYDRNIQIAFALAAYQAETGRYPAKLDELAPKYLATVPADLFSGRPLIYRPTKKGYVFYSVGINGKDDGGRFSDDDPPGDDLGVRMPLPELKAKK